MRLKKTVQLLFVILLFPFAMMAQVTSSSITGNVLSSKNEPLEGATITATHLPSGSAYTTVTKKGGSFTLSSLRIGGPYTLTVSYVGLTPQVIKDIELSLGEPYNVNVVLDNDACLLYTSRCV